MIKVLSAIILLLLAFVSEAQINHKTKTEAGMGLTIVSSYTDIGGTEGTSQGFPDFRLSDQRPAIFGFYKYNFDQALSVRANAKLGVLSSSDAGSRNEARGYAFNTTFIELTAIGQYFLIRESQPYYYASALRRGRSWSQNQRVAVYINAGLGAICYTVKRNKAMKATNSPNLNDGKTISPVFPVGLGFNYPVRQGMRVFAEFQYALTLTDYLDGYHNPDYSKHNDMYFSLNLGLTYQFGEKMMNWNKTKIRR